MLVLLSAAFAGESTLMIGIDHPGRADDIAVHGGTQRACYPRARFCVFDYPDGQPLPIAALEATAGVRYVEVDRLIPQADLQSMPVDAAGTADCSDLWELEAINAGAAWGVASGTFAPVVAIADGGFLTSHEEIADRISGQYDYGNGDSVAEVEWSVGVPAHGTFIAGIVAADGENGVGRVGIVPDGRLNLLKIADRNGAFYYSYAASALADIAEGDLGVRVVNYSIASSSTTTSFTDAVAALADADILMVAAAGNCGSADCWDADNDSHPLYPASFTFEHVITVAGSTPGAGFNTYSHYGQSSVDLAAPGVDICSLGAESESDYYAAAGTSYSAPIVAGVAALLLEVHPDLTTTELARVLRASAADSPDWADRVRSGGVLDAEAALTTAVPRLEPSSTITVEGTGVFDVSLRNVGAEGQGLLLLTHDDALSVTDAGDWSVQPYGPGDTLDLPDAGAVVMSGTGTLLSGPIDAHRAEVLAISLAGHEVGAWSISTRLSLSSAGADYLNAPYSDGTADETGFYALSSSVTVTAVAEVDTGADTAEDTDTPADTDSPSADDSGETSVSVDEDTPKGCGCASTTAPVGWWLVIGVVLVGRRTWHLESGARQVP